MFLNLIDKKHIFQKPENSKVILSIPLCARTLIFFCDNLMFYHYSVLDEKILYQSRLPGRIIQAIPYSGHQILCTILETRALMLLNIRDKSLEQVKKLPLTKLHIESRQKDLFTQTKLLSFEKSNSFAIEQPLAQDFKAVIYFYTKPSLLAENSEPIKIQTLGHKQFSTRKHIIRKLDSYNRLVYFKQQIEENGILKFSTINCKENFAEKQYHLENKAFSRLAIVRQIVSISSNEEDEKLLIFINCYGPQILLVQHNEVRQYSYKTNKLFLNIVLLNIQCGYGIFTFMPDPEQSDPDCAQVIELIELSKGIIHQSKKCRHNYEIHKSWEDDYLLQYKRQINSKETSTFFTSHIVDKKTIYMKMMWQKGFSQCSENFMMDIFQHFE